jgi:hypothetical protein
MERKEDRSYVIKKSKVKNQKSKIKIKKLKIENCNRKLKFLTIPKIPIIPIQTILKMITYRKTIRIT